MQTVYEVREPPLLRVNSAFSAVVDPMLMSENRIATTMEMRTALTGTFQPGVTCQGQLGLEYLGEGKKIQLTRAMAPEKGTPLSRANDQI